MRFRRLEQAAMVHPWRGRVVPALVCWWGIVVSSLLASRLASQAALASVLVALALGSRADIRLWIGSVALSAGVALTGCGGLLVGWDPLDHRMFWNGSALPQVGPVLSRSVVCAGATLLLAQTVPFSRLLDGLSRLGIPRDLLEIALLVHRAILLLEESWRGIHRGLSGRNGLATWKGRSRAMGWGIAALMVRSQRMSIRQEMALASRGGTGGLPVLATRGEPMPLAIFASVALVGSVGIMVWILETGHGR